ncbi:MAG: 50S ribosomal protein L24 [uncultured bacterium]|uniref:Large ribosomal subunit protein uL24 n=4 Tax=Candidatus Daviesiibacteriota TaxID=1752718 RepID=A0A0G0FA48_9BACT|nr:MAG: 50S ribosomal protein L24 [uncultured bacterium]KKQ10410.1 MAG: 50S ribosomal protein L24 [Candidatus Daviesbacteria bacterium GW2011_GWB1_36_5]KKQ15789.1 MAG: 50S ribosomal protein L24 [Candidatus Daviesbacteria bacterium GW2011_GWA1_36_8]OGE16569.1 MAG: 50S ribosomal protein L24 [Candidatus Daviesbacteria bacterium RIFCSPHIGHO2_01_FULL_36_37]OGE31750.1 MAG: 50S ribosomal protein L24 [Candidatus Daviesbacteria bacterium RIFCSPHIGHO2_02_FULL_37_9]OGE34652.1 MAG: 50S ribosomal protein L
MQKLKKGDNVMVLVGKDRGRSGAIERIDTKKGKALVLGVNIFKRHVRKTGQMEGGIIEIAKPVNLSNLALVCPNCKRPTRVGFQIEAGKKMRICKKCRKEIK